MREEEEYSILQKKFRDWFGKTVPVSIPLPDEVDRSIGDPIPADLALSYEADHSIGDPVLTALPFSAEADHLNHETRRRHADSSQNLSELLNLGFNGAVFLGAVVGAIIVFLNLSIPGWYSDYWPNQFIIIFLAILLGFNIGVSKGYVSQQREKYFYNGKL